jgi:hypothetical protein
MELSWAEFWEKLEEETQALLQSSGSSQTTTCGVVSVMIRQTVVAY